MVIEKSLLPLLTHHAKRAQRGQIKNAIRNCHVHGLHSIMLHDEPENRVRMFYCDESHELWRNHFESDKWSLGAHSHHCDLKLQLVHGCVVNTILDPNVMDTLRAGWVDAYLYESALLGAAGSLSYVGYKRFFEARSVYLSSFDMSADTIHTVFVEQGEEAAWLVFEGKEDPNYSSICYTNNPVFDPKGMYLTDPSVATEAFKWLNLI